MNKPTNVCNNCGKTGHSFHHCKLPITSYGIILFTYQENKQKFNDITERVLLVYGFY